MLKDQKLKDEILEKYTGDNLINVLHLIQKKEGYISKEAMLFLSEEFKIPAAVIHSAASFYEYFTFKKHGKKNVKVCENIACNLNNSFNLIESIKKITGLDVGESNKEFSIEKVSCIGCCNKAPAMLVNDEFVGELDEIKLQDILNS